MVIRQNTREITCLVDLFKYANQDVNLSMILIRSWDDFTPRKHVMLMYMLGIQVVVTCAQGWMSEKPHACHFCIAMNHGDGD